MSVLSLETAGGSAGDLSIMGVGGGATGGGVPAGCSFAVGGSKCSMPLKISLQWPQRTSPARNFN
jgi:hypothetical protein